MPHCVLNPLTLNFEGITSFKSSEVALVVKDPPANAEDARDVGSIPRLERSTGEGNGNPLQYSCLEHPWTEEPGRLQSMGLQRVKDMTE